MSVKLVEVTRGGIIESIHRGDIAVVDSDGKIIFSVGDANRITFMRSTSKPLQALAALETGIAEEFGLDLKEIAILASSHSGEKEHIATLEGLLNKIGVDIDVLECGIHEPLNKEAASLLIKENLTPTKLHCNCSAKHVSLLAAAKILGLPVQGYTQREHPIQARVRKLIADFGGTQVEQIQLGVDGCGTLVHALPLQNMAMAYANICNQTFHDGKYQKSQNYIISAMTMHPEMVAGKGRFDTELMKVFGDRLISKIGAEGVHCTGIIGKSIGIAIKIEDGNNRAINPVVVALLIQLGIIKQDELKDIKAIYNPDILNHKGEVVGEIRAALGS